MQNQTQELARRRAEVQQLAGKVHRAKVEMDHKLWGPGGLPTDPEALARCIANLRRARGPNSVSIGIEQAHLATLAYHKVRAQFPAFLKTLQSVAGTSGKAESGHFLN